MFFIIFYHICCSDLASLVSLHIATFLYNGCLLDRQKELFIITSHFWPLRGTLRQKILDCNVLECFQAF